MTPGSSAISRSNLSMVFSSLYDTCSALRVDKETIGVRTVQAARDRPSCVPHPFLLEKGL